MNYIGIDLGGTRIKIGLVNKEGVADKVVIDAESDKGLETYLPLIDKGILKLMKKSKLSSLSGIGMAFPGVVNPKSKKILSTNKKYDDGPEIDLHSYYSKKWSTPFFIDNDSRMATVGEWKYGAGKDSNDLVMVTLGTGVGTGVVMEGNLLRGKHFKAGCLGGHFVVNYQGKVCTCGNIGCVEAEAATWNIDQQLREHTDFSCSVLSGIDKIDFAAVFMATEDKLAIKMQEHCLEVWSAGVISYINAYDPEVVVLGGGVLNSAAKIVPHIRKKISENVWTPWGETSLRLTKLWDNAAILGTVYSLRNNI